MRGCARQRKDQWMRLGERIAVAFAAPGKSGDERVAHGGQKRACLVPRGVRKEQGSGERVAWSQD